MNQWISRLIDATSCAVFVYTSSNPRACEQDSPHPSRTQNIRQCALKSESPCFSLLELVQHQSISQSIRTVKNCIMRQSVVQPTALEIIRHHLAATMATTSVASSPSLCSASSSSDATSDSIDLVASPPRASRERPHDWLERRRKIEHQSRQKRKEKFQSMPAQVARLERAAVAVRLASDPDVIWDEFLDEETKQLRDKMRQIMKALDEAKRLNAEKVQLHQLLKEKELVRNSVAYLVRRMETATDWDTSERHWRLLARRHFRPLTDEQCIDHISDALVEMNRFMTSYDRQSSGLSFLGWRDSRRVLPHESTLQFSFDKKFQGVDLTNHMNTVWRVFTEQELYGRLVHGGRANVAVEILQQVSPTAVVVRISENYDGLPVTFHEVFLVFVVTTDTGFVQYRTCLHDTELQRVMNKSSDIWASNNFWIRWDVLDPSRDPSSADYQFSLGGSLHGNDPGFLRRWMCEILAAIIRIEAVINRKSMLQF